MVDFLMEADNDSNAEEDIDPKSEEVEFAEGDMTEKYPKQEPVHLS